MKIKELIAFNESIKELDHSSPKVKEALQTLQERISYAENISEAPKIRAQMEDIQIQLKELQLTKQLKELEKSLGEIELDFEPVPLKGKIPEGIKGILFE